MLSRIQQLKKTQNKVCQLCGRTVTRLECDHDHETGKARGIVCMECNRYVIKAAEVRPELAAPQVLNYLTNPPLKDHDLMYQRVPPPPKEWPTRSVLEPEEIMEEVRRAGEFCALCQNSPCRLILCQTGRELEL